MTATVDDAPMPPPPPKVLTPEELFKPELAPSLTSVPETAPPAKTKKKAPKKKKTTVAAGASLDVATARLQKAIATPAPAPPPKTGKTGSSGKSSRSKGLPDAGPLQD